MRIFFIDEEKISESIWNVCFKEEILACKENKDGKPYVERANNNFFVLFSGVEILIFHVSLKRRFPT